MADENSRMICNPHLGKPAYITAGNPCVRVFKEGSLQEPPEPVDPIDESEDELITPSCLTVVFASDSGEITPSMLTFNEDTGRYENPNGDTIIYDRALGWIVQTGLANYNPVTVTLNPTNSYCSTEGNTLSIVECSKLGGSFLPSCVATVFAQDPNIVMGEFLNDGNGNFTPEDTSQGTLVYSSNNVWTLSIGPDIYTGSTTQSEIEGSYVNADGQILVLSNNGCDVPDVVVEPIPDPITPTCITLVFSSSLSEPSPSDFTYDANTEEYTSENGSVITYDDDNGWVVTTPNSVFNPAMVSLSPVNSYSDDTGNSLSFVECANVGTAFLPDCIQTVFADDTEILLGQFGRNSDTEYTPADPLQGLVTFFEGNWVIGFQDENGNLTTYTGSANPSEVTGVYTDPLGRTILITECP